MELNDTTAMPTNLDTCITEDHINGLIVKEQYHQFPGTTVTVCCLTLENGYNAVASEACADPENFDAEKGRYWARKAAVRKVWPLEGYLLRERLHMSAKLAEQARQKPKRRDKLDGCPHAEPMVYCPECVANPCPIGLNGKTGGE